MFTVLKLQVLGLGTSRFSFLRCSFLGLKTLAFSLCPHMTDPSFLCMQTEGEKERETDRCLTICSFSFSYEDISSPDAFWPYLIFLTPLKASHPLTIHVSQVGAHTPRCCFLSLNRLPSPGNCKFLCAPYFPSSLRTAKVSALFLTLLRPCHTPHSSFPVPA